MPRPTTASPSSARSPQPARASVSSRTRPISAPSGGGRAGVRRARGIALASGDYVSFPAADDWVMPGFFALALEMLDRYPQAGLFCGDTILVEGESDRCRGYRPVVKPFYRAGAA